MTINYTTLVGTKSTSGSIASWVNRTDLPVTDILTETEAWIYESLRVREMHASQALTFAADASSASLPAGFLDPLHFVPYGWGQELKYKSLEEFQPARDDDGALLDGTPCMWTVEGETTAKVDVNCIDEFAGWLTYYKRPTALGSGNTTNFLTTRYPKLLRIACMAQAFEWAKDSDRAAAYFAGATKLIMDAAVANDLYRRGQ